MGDNWDRIMAVKEDLGVDDEIFYAILYERMAYDPCFTARRFIGFLDRYMSLFPGDIRAERKLLHSMALDKLYEEIARLGLPLEQTANRMAKREFETDNVRWLRCWQLSKLVYCLRKKGPGL